MADEVMMNIEDVIKLENNDDIPEVSVSDQTLEAAIVETAQGDTTDAVDTTNMEIDHIAAKGPDTQIRTNIVVNSPILLYGTADTRYPLCKVTGNLGILHDCNNGFLHVSTIVSGVGRIAGYIKYKL